MGSTVVPSEAAALCIIVVSVASSVMLTVVVGSVLCEATTCSPSAAYSAYATGSVPREATTPLKVGSEHVTSSSTCTCRASHSPTSGSSGGVPRMKLYSASYAYTSCDTSPRPPATSVLAAVALTFCSSVSTCASAVSGVARSASTDVKRGACSWPPSSVSEHA